MHSCVLYLTKTSHLFTLCNDLYLVLLVHESIQWYAPIHELLCQGTGWKKNTGESMQGYDRT